ncbi:hypothetical protein [Paenibacillus turpanensis]|uniref:hypothetical protein n=1 Tax=Paenibacillus turpanensis TaxID=2689078 RepID=UPI00140E583A|nr:hypothetical protein [Paenibacillus turpanensis]
MINQIILYVLLFGPWISLFWAKKGSVRRYMPVTIFTSFLMTIVFQIAYTYDWWTIHSYIVPWGYMIDVSFAYGLFAVGTFWVFYFTSQRFWLYSLTNLALDSFFCFVGFPGLQYFGIASLNNITTWQYLIVIYAVSMIIYVYHRWQSKIFTPPSSREIKRTTAPSPFEIEVQLGKREKIK